MPSTSAPVKSERRPLGAALGWRTISLFAYGFIPAVLLTWLLLGAHKIDSKSGFLSGALKLLLLHAGIFGASAFSMALLAWSSGNTIFEHSSNIRTFLYSAGWTLALFGVVGVSVGIKKFWPQRFSIRLSTVIALVVATSGVAGKTLSLQDASFSEFALLPILGFWPGYHEAVFSDIAVDLPARTSG